MPEPSWSAVRGIMMTSERIGAYGGIAFAPELLESVAESIRSRAMPLHADHDVTKAIRTRNTDAFVKARPDGIHELHFTFEIHTDDLHWVESRSGVSVTLMAPLDRPEDFVEPTDPSVEVSADHAWFPDESLLNAERTLIAQGIEADAVATQRAYQFSFTPDPQIFITVTLGLLTSVAGSAIWASIAVLFRQRRTPVGGSATQPTTINYTVKNGDKSLTAKVQTSDKSVARRAFDELGETVQSILVERGSTSASSSTSPSTTSSVVVWNDSLRQWVPPT